MSKDQKDLLKRLDELNKNIELLAKVIAVNVGKDTLFKEKTQKDQQIEFLLDLGLSRNIIASMVVTTPLTVSVIKSQKKSKQTPASGAATPPTATAEKSK